METQMDPAMGPSRLILGEPCKKSPPGPFEVYIDQFLVVWATLWIDIQKHMHIPTNTYQNWTQFEISDIFGPVWSHMDQYGPVLSNIVHYGPVWSSMVPRLKHMWALLLTNKMGFVTSGYVGWSLVF